MMTGEVLPVGCGMLRWKFLPFAIVLCKEKVRDALAALQDTDGSRRKHSSGLQQLQKELNRLERDRDRASHRDAAVEAQESKERDKETDERGEDDNESCDESNASLNGTSILARRFRSAYFAEESRIDCDVVGWIFGLVEPDVVPILFVEAVGISTGQIKCLKWLEQG
eukprot:Skav221136  [mRNA]  locus=scaffold233:676103:677761:- [translate_table: standard]